jgi:hypothetical protein
VYGNKKRAVQLLGIQRPTLYNKLKRYAIELQNPFAFDPDTFLDFGFSILD